MTWFEPWYLLWVLALAAIYPRPNAPFQVALSSLCITWKYIVFGFVWFWYPDLHGLEMHKRAQDSDSRAAGKQASGIDLESEEQKRAQQRYPNRQRVYQRGLRELQRNACH